MLLTGWNWPQIAATNYNLYNQLSINETWCIRLAKLLTLFTKYLCMAQDITFGNDKHVEMITIDGRISYHIFDWFYHNDFRSKTKWNTNKVFVVNSSLLYSQLIWWIFPVSNKMDVSKCGVMVVALVTWTALIVVHVIPFTKPYKGEYRSTRFSKRRSKIIIIRFFFQNISTKKNLFTICFVVSTMKLKIYK